MDSGVKQVYNLYGDKLNCIDTNCQGTPYFSPIEKGFYIDSNADVQNPLGAGSTFFHESGHMIDWLLGKDVGIDYITTMERFTDYIQADLDDALEQIMVKDGCTMEEAKQKLSDVLIQDPYNSSCVSDVFGGLTGNQVSGVFGHSTNYWTSRSRDSVGREAFAEITEQIACNTEALAFTKSMLPKTYEAYQNIITATVRGYK